MEASWAGAGIIPPGNPGRAASAFDRLRAFSSRMFPELSDELHKITGIDNGYRVTGGLEVFDSDDNEAIRLWQAEGIEFQPRGKSEVAGLEPNLRLASFAYLLPGMAQVRNPWHVRPWWRPARVREFNSSPTLRLKS